MAMDLKKIQDVDMEAMFGSVFGVSGPGMYQFYNRHFSGHFSLMLGHVFILQQLAGLNYDRGFTQIFLTQFDAVFKESIINTSYACC